VRDAPGEAFGPYVVYEQLGAGGMALVHRAEATGIEGFSRPVALKRMLAHVADNQDMIAAFVREARIASYMRHRNVAQTYELGKVGDTYFIAMELISGFTLRDVLKHCATTTGPMPVPIALNILNQICDALDYAHNLCDDSGQPLGIIHRDVSPSNIIVAEGGVVKLIDFGIAKASAAGMQTMSGTIKGKFGYMAPEYVAGSLDARADLFAVGVIAHELLTNRPLFTAAEDMETLNRVMKMEVQPPSRFNPQVPPEIDDVVMTALQRDPDARWQHATALRTALTTLTRRLGLGVQDAQVIEWLGWALDQTRPRGQALRVQLPTPVRGHAAALRDASGSTELVPPVSADDETLLAPATALDDGRDDDIVITPTVETAPPLETAMPPFARMPAPRVEPSSHPGPWVPSAPPPAHAYAPPIAPPIAPPQQTAPPKTRAAVVVVLVLLAAALAGIGVHFALPLLTE